MTSVWLQPRPLLCTAFPRTDATSPHHRPTSTGTVRLKSANPHDPPVIDPRYLSTEHDVAVLVRAARLLAKILHTEPLASMLDPAGKDDAALDHAFHELDDAAVAEGIRRKAETLYHPACTARMAPREEAGVVDPFLRVHGIPNLRVVDASVFPTIVSGHTVSNKSNILLYGVGSCSDGDAMCRLHRRSLSRRRRRT